MDQSEELAGLRAEVARAHARVAAGDYAGAVGLFSELLPKLRHCLGGDHPEVAELADDLQTAADMGGVADFGEGLGLGWVSKTGPED